MNAKDIAKAIARLRRLQNHGQISCEKTIVGIKTGERTLGSVLLSRPGFLEEVVRELRRIPTTRSATRKQVRAAHAELYNELRHEFTFKELMEKLKLMFPRIAFPQRTVRYIVKVDSLPLAAGKKTGRPKGAKTLRIGR